MGPNKVVRIVVLGVLVAIPAALGAGQDRRDAAAQEAFLRSAPIITVGKKEESGRSNAWKVYLDNGQVASKAIFKYVDRQRPRPFPSSYRYELAAYSLDGLLGLGLVPPTVERTIDNVPGSLQAFCEGVVTEAIRKRKDIAPPDVTRLQDEFAKVSIFENLTNCVRENENDVLIRTSDWKVWRIDYSEAFGPEAALIPDSILTRCPRDVFRKLKDLADAEYRARIETYLNPEELDAVLARKRLIVERLDALIKDKGENAVLFDR